MLSIINARYLDHYRLELTFNDKKNGIADLEEIIKKDHRKIFKELIDLTKFKNFHLAADTIVWANGLDLAPEFLYEKI